MRNFGENIFKYFQNGYGYSKRITLSFSNGITLGNADVVSEEFSIDQTLCDEENLTIGKVCPARMYVKIYDTQHSYKGQICTISLSSYDDSDNLLASISLGTFTITSDNRTADKLYRELVGYDALYTLSKLSYLDKWLTYSKGSTKKTYSAFVSDFLDDVVLAISCTIDKQYVLNSIYNKLSSVTIKGNTGQNGLSYLDMLQMICETLGFFAFLDFKGELRFIPVKSTATQLVDYAFTSGADGSTTDKATRLTSATKVSYVPSDYFINGFNYEDYLTANYTQVSVVSENLDGEDASDNYTTYSQGVSGVNYTIDCNILTKGWTSSQLMYILHGWAQTFNFANIGYKPSDLSKQYDPRIELGDYIQVTTPLNEVVIFPVLKRRISGIIAMRDNYIAGGDEISGTVGVSISSSSGATVGYAQIDLSNIKGAVITNSLIKDSTIENSKIKNATIDFAKMNSAFVGDLTSNTAFVNELQTNVLTAEFIQSAVADVGYLRAEYVQADETYSLISTIGQLSAELSLLKDVHITQSGKISGYLDAVEVNANSITAGKLIADHIYLKGDNGLLYQLNIDNQYSLIDDKPSDWNTNYANYFTKTYTLTSSEPSDWETNYYTDYYVSDGQGGYTLVQEQASVPTWQANTYYQVSYVANASSVWAQNTYYRHNSTPSTTTLDGNAITNRTITADHIVAGTITSNEIASNTITADNILANTITGSKIASNTITANEIASGTITADEIATNTITANKINLTDVFSQNITASGTITGVTIKAKSADNNIQLDINGLTFSNGDGNIYGRIYGNAIGLDANKGLYIGATNYTHITGSTVIMPGRKLYVGDPDDGTSYMEITRTTITAPGLITGSGFYAIRSTGFGFIHKHGTSGTQISFGVGADGTNRGIYDDVCDNWMIYRKDDTTTVYFNGALKPATTATYALGDASHIWGNLYTEAMRLYRSTSYYYQFVGTPTANRTITFQNASGTVAFTSSDARLKRNIENTDLSGLDMVNKMQIRQFDWVNDESAGYNKGRHQTIGFVADELEQLDKYFIVDGSGGEDEDGNINPKCVDTFYLLGYITKALQELSAKVDELEKKVR